jgi:hypothetical protein
MEEFMKDLGKTISSMEKVIRDLVIIPNMREHL